MVYWSVNGKSQMKSGSMIWLIVGLTLLSSGCPFKSGVEGKAWFRYASKYDQAMSKAWISGGAIQPYDKVFKMEQKFLRAKQPTETEIISVLRSPNRRFQKVALVAMSIRPIETDQLTDILFEFLHDQDPEFRWYAMKSLDKFTTFPESRKADLGKQLLEVMKKRIYSLPLFEQFNLLVRFSPEGTVQFLTDLVMKEGEERRIGIFRHLALRPLKEMGDSYYDQAAEYVNKHGSPEIKKELLEHEKWWEKGRLELEKWLEEKKMSKLEKNKDL